LSHLEGLAVIPQTSVPLAVPCSDVVPSFLTKGLTIARRPPNHV